MNTCLTFLSQVNFSYHKLKLADWVVSLKSIPIVTAIVAPGPSDAAQRKKEHLI